MVDLINGDCIEEMQRLIDEGVQVDSVVTDPPYHLTSIVKRFGKASIDDNTYTSEKVRNGADGYSRLIRTGFMGKEWDGGDIAFRAETWELALKLLKPGGHLLAFSASRNYHRMAVAIEDAGFEIRDQLMWLYGSGFPKSQGIGKVIDKKVGKYDTNYGTTTTNTQQKRINIHGEERGSRKCNRCQKDVKHQYDCKDTQCGMKYNYSSEEAKQWAGWGTALKPAHEPIVMARKPISEKSIVDNVLKHGTGGINIDECKVESKRFPANVMHDGSEEIINEFAKYGERKSCTSPSKATPEGKIFGGKRSQGNLPMDTGTAARFFYCPKVSKSERGKDNTHPTVKPQELMKYLCRLVTPKGGIVLDPFMGSGSTGLAAKDEGFEFIGIEREKEYFEICKSRIEKSSPLMEFFE